MVRELKHTLLSLLLFVLGGAFTAFSIGIFAEAYDQWMFRKRKIGHYEGWNWWNFLGRCWLPVTFGALTYFNLNWVLVFLPPSLWGFLLK